MAREPKQFVTEPMRDTLLRTVARDYTPAHARMASRAWLCVKHPVVDSCVRLACARIVHRDGDRAIRLCAIRLCALRFCACCLCAGRLCARRFTTAARRAHRAFRQRLRCVGHARALLRALRLRVRCRWKRRA
eukprot:6173206-Pleurochrysis_carterae.AAC.3